MASEKDIVTNKAKTFIYLLQKNGIDVSEAYLFGSVTKGIIDEDSDIDLAIVSSDFGGLPFYDIKKISKYRREIDLRFEIHPFSLKDIEADPPLFFAKIKKEGVRLD